MPYPENNTFEFGVLQGFPLFAPLCAIT